MLTYDYAIQKGEDMATNILLVNQKGGVGKTTFADEIAWGLERRGHKVGFGNLDPQGGANHEKNLLDDEDAVNVIDTPGFLSDETAVYAKNADIAIIPVQPGTLGLKPMKRTIKVITEANPDLSFAIIVNNFAANQTVDRQFLELLEADDLPVLGTVPTAAAFKQGAALGKPCTKSRRAARPPRQSKTSWTRSRRSCNGRKVQEIDLLLRRRRGEGRGEAAENR